MGISDRAYAGERRGGGFPGGLSFNSWLIIANVAIFVVGLLAPAAESWLKHYGHFSTFQLIHRLEFWRLVTFQFLHAGPIHLALNMLGLWVFGRMVEEYLGFKRYAAFYLVCGIFGGVGYLFLNLMGLMASGVGLKNLPIVLYGSGSTPLVGASAGVFGVIMACAFIAPNTIVQLLIPPVPIRLKLMAYAYVGIAAINLVLGGNNAGGDAAHLGGAVAGYFFIRRTHLLRDFFDVLGDSRKNRSAAKSQARAAKEQEEVDRILAKVSEKGLRSLTSGEKRALARATERGRS